MGSMKVRERMEEERLKVKGKKIKKVKNVEVAVNGESCVDLDSSQLIGKKHVALKIYSSANADILKAFLAVSISF